jgi:hypothetical protein
MGNMLTRIIHRGARRDHREAIERRIYVRLEANLVYEDCDDQFDSLLCFSASCAVSSEVGDRTTLAYKCYRTFASVV